MNRFERKSLTFNRRFQTNYPKNARQLELKLEVIKA